MTVAGDKGFKKKAKTLNPIIPEPILCEYCDKPFSVRLDTILLTLVGTTRLSNQFRNLANSVFTGVKI